MARLDFRREPVTILPGFTRKRRGRVRRPPLRTGKLRQGLTLVETAVVILVLGIITSVLFSFVASLPVLQSSRSEAERVEELINFARETAIRSGQTIYIEFNLDEGSYRLYRWNRKGESPEEEEIVNPGDPTSRNRITSIVVGRGERVNRGKVTAPFQPDGTAEEIAFYLGSPGDISQTIIVRRYGNRVDLYEGEKYFQLEKPEWREDLNR